MQVDYLIVGQGISGSVIALTLTRLGKSVAIISRPELSSSSLVAAGVYNPFNFRRSIPTWKAKMAADIARSFYTEAEQLLDAKFHSEKNIVRVFASEPEREEWKNYLHSDSPLFAKRVCQETEFGHVKTPHGYGLLSGGGIVHTGRFLDSVRAYFNNRGYYLQERFDFSLVKTTGDGINYDNRVSAQRLIFCEGHLADGNPFFPPKVIAPTKGEVLHVEIPGLQLSEIVNGPVYLAALGNDHYVCGATFNPGKSDEAITEVGKSELLGKLKSLTDLPVRVIGQFAGVRPAGRDRKPVLGVSRRNEDIAIFNGMGSKAVMLAPYLAQVLVNHLETGDEILPEIRLTRFKDTI